MTGMAALTLCAAFTSCNKNENLFDPYAKGEAAKADYKKNFSEIVGEINPNQDWKLLGDMTAEVSVNLGIAQAYTVAIYNDNPNTNKEASLLGIAENVAEGATVTIKFTGELAKTTYYIGVFNEKGRGVYQTAQAVNNKIVANIGGSSNARTRASESTSSYGKSAADYLNGLTEAEMATYYELTDNVIANETNDGATLQNGKWGWDASANNGNGASVQLPVGTDSKHFRVAPGVEVTKTFHMNITSGVVNEGVIYVQGKLNVGTGYTLNSTTIVVANGGELALSGTVNATNASRIVVLGGGKVTAARGTVLTVNNAGPCYNAGTISYDGELNTNGSDFYNCGTVNVDLLRNTSGGIITNFGSITARTDAGAADTYNCTVINGCYMHYTENAGVGTLTLLNNSRIDIDGQAEFAGTVTMYEYSMVNAGSLYLTNTVFAGPSSNYSIVKTSKILVGQADDLKQSGNSWFDWDVDEIYNKQNVKQTLAMEDGVHGIRSGVAANITKFTSEATSPFSIDPSECTGAGYNKTPDEKVEIPENPQYCSIAFEDLGSTFDLDFNDIVVYVAYYAKSQKTTAQIVCAGGTLPVDLMYNGEVIDSKSGGINHNYNGKVCPITTPCDVTKFQIKVVDGESSTIVESYTVQGSAPQALVIPNKWQWPGELQNITEVYPTFAGWVSSNGALNWYE